LKACTSTTPCHMNTDRSRWWAVSRNPFMRVEFLNWIGRQWRLNHLHVWSQSNTLILIVQRTRDLGQRVPNTPVQPFDMSVSVVVVVAIFWVFFSFFIMFLCYLGYCLPLGVTFIFEFVLVLFFIVVSVLTFNNTFTT
jgi:hypothetical protein